MLIYLKDALFAADEETRSMSGTLVYLMVEGNKGSKKLFEALLPKVWRQGFKSPFFVVIYIEG